MKLVFVKHHRPAGRRIVVVSAEKLPDDCRDQKYHSLVGCDTTDGFRFDLEANRCLPVQL